MKKETIRIEISGGLGKSYIANFIKDEFPKYSYDKVKIRSQISSEFNGNILIITRNTKEK